MCAFRSKRQEEYLRENDPALWEEFRKTPPEDELRRRSSEIAAGEPVRRNSNTILRMRKPRRRG